MTSTLVSLVFGISLYLLSISGGSGGVKKSSLEITEKLFDQIGLKKQAISDLYTREDGQVVWSTHTTWREPSAAGVFYPVLSEQGFSIFLQGDGPFRRVFRSRSIVADPNSKYFIEWAINPTPPHKLWLKLFDGDREIALDVVPGSEESVYYFQPMSTKIELELQLENDLVPLKAGKVAQIKFINIMQAK